MFKNYLLVALRNASRHKGYSLINIIGLAIGMTVCILVWQFVSYEKSYDNFHQNKDNLYRLEVGLYSEGRMANYMSRIPYAVGPTMKEEFPEVLEYTRLFHFGGGVVNYNDISIKVEDIFCVDPSFPTMFSFPLIKGNPETALKGPNDALISESAAKKFFGDQDPIGKVIQYDRLVHLEYTITGVFKDVPHNSHLQFDFLFSIHHILQSPSFKGGWQVPGFFTYVLLNPHTHHKALEAKTPKMIEKYLGDTLNQLKLQPRYFFQPMLDIYMNSPNPGSKIKNRNKNIILFSSIIALFILIIAWINYINLATARSIERGKEVSLRKVVGATRLGLIKQFLFESGFFNAAGVILAILLVLILTPGFNQLLDLPASFYIFQQAAFWLLLVLFLGVGIFLSGTYPAFILSSVQPITMLKGKIMGRGSRNILRKILVVFQLIISIILITGTVTLYRQLGYMQNQDLGINTAQVLVVRAPVTLDYTDRSRIQVHNFFNELKEYPTIEHATIGDVPGKSYSSRTSVAREGNFTPILVARCWADYDYFNTYQIKLLAGRFFSKEIVNDRTSAVILNQTALRIMGFDNPEEALNQFIIDQDDKVKLKIVGVIKNYHQKSLRERIPPTIFQLASHYGATYFAFKLETKNIRDTIALIKEKWNKRFPGNPFEYTFLDDFFNQQYKVEKIFGSVFTTLSFLAIFIACIGIFGLFSHSTLQRTKEIGIRKVFGANTSGILVLLLKGLLKLLLVSILIAFPISYLAYSKVLQFYAYRTGIGVWFFLVPLAIIVPIILLTTAYHIIKAARATPIKSLRYE